MVLLYNILNSMDYLIKCNTNHLHILLHMRTMSAEESPTGVQCDYCAICDCDAFLHHYLSLYAVRELWMVDVDVNVVGSQPPGVCVALFATFHNKHFGVI